MSFTLPDLPYEKHALEPHISKETLEYHYGKHHQKYVDTLNDLVKGTDDEKRELEDIVKRADGKLFNQAAQVWNHTFYWHCLSPAGGEGPSGELKACIEHCFGSVEKFKEAFNAKAAANFGSGWTWLVKVAGQKNKLEIINTDDADTPIAGDRYVPLLTVDVWEHAYYIDYRNARPDYLDAIWKVVNWDFVQDNFSHPEKAVSQFKFAA
ncbi:superoxide dismutase [Litorivivens sp.]|uniref:superoxide dismutase n=1 Tax=Litorivivens sp. TaxID=2020868 RepID=UPI0035612ED6